MSVACRFGSFVNGSLVLFPLFPIPTASFVFLSLRMEFRAPFPPLSPFLLPRDDDKPMERNVVVARKVNVPKFGNRALVVVVVVVVVDTKGRMVCNLTVRANWIKKIFSDCISICCVSFTKLAERNSTKCLRRGQFHRPLLVVAPLLHRVFFDAR